MKPIFALILASLIPHLQAADDDVPLLMPQEKAASEKQTTEFNEAIRPALAVAAKSTVRVWSGSTRLAYGTVVGDGSKILSKWSEIARATRDLRVDGNDPKQVRAVHVMGVYKDEDLVVLEIEGAPFTPVTWSFEAPKLGSFLAAPQPDGRISAFGVVSVLERSLRDSDLAYLGIILEPGFLGKGVKIADIDPKSGAAAAGLKPGNIILKVGERSISGLLALKNALTTSAPGEKISLLVQTDGTEKKVEVALGNHPPMPQFGGGRLAQMELMGGPVSRVRDSFTHVIQTDMRTNTSQIGGPVVDLKGRILGITMARADRTRSFVMPATAVVNLLKTEPVKPETIGAEKRQRPSLAASNRQRSLPPSRQAGPRQPAPDEDDADAPKSPLEQAERMQRHIIDMQQLLDFMREEMKTIEEQN